MIASPVSRMTYAGAGLTGPFAFTFKILATADLLVTKRQVTGIEVTLVYVTDWSLAVGANVGDPSGSINLVVALAVGETLTIRRAPALLQPTSLQNQTAYYGATHETEFDRLVMQIQELQDQLSRSFGVSETYDPATLGLRVSPGAAGQVLGWSNSTHLTSMTVSAGATVLPGNGRTVSSLSSYLADNAVFNAIDYGGDPSGITDSTTALTNCIAMASDGGTGGVVDIPDGTFTVTSLPLGNVFRIRGRGINKTYIKVTSTVVDGVYSSPTLGCVLCSISDLSIIGPRSGTTNGLVFGNTLVVSSHSRVANIAVSGFSGGVQMKFINHVNGKFTHLYGGGAGGAGGAKGISFTRDGSSLPGANAFNIVRYAFSSNNITDFYVDHGYDNIFEYLYLFNEVAYVNTLHHLWVKDGGENYFKKAHIEPQQDCTGAQVLFDGTDLDPVYAQGNTMEDCIWWGVGKAGDCVQVGTTGTAIQMSMKFIRPTMMTPKAGSVCFNLQAHYFTLIDRPIRKIAFNAFTLYPPTITNTSNQPLQVIPFYQSNPATRFTLAAAPQTVVLDAGVTGYSTVVFTPINAPAATLMGSAKAIYHLSTVHGVSFTLQTANAVAAAGTEIFSYQLI